MFFIRYLLFFSGVNGAAKMEDLSVVYDIVESVLRYFQSPSVIFVLDDERLGSSDAINFLKLQTMLSSSNFYFSSLSTPSIVLESFRNPFQNRKETVVFLQPDEKLTRCLEKLSNEMDISNHNWLLLSINGSKSFERIKIPLPSEFVLAHGNDSAGYDLYEMYDITPYRRATNIVGRWAVGSPLVLAAPSEGLLHRRRDLQGGTITVLSSRADPCADNSFVEGVAPIVECIHKRIWDIFAEMLNATTQIVVVDNLDRKTIECTEAELTFRSAPLNPYDFETRSYLWPSFRVRVEVVASYLPQMVEWRTFILPFSRELWMVTLAWLILCDLVLALVGFFNGGKSSEKTFWQHFGESSFRGAFVLCNQGSPTFSKFISYRIVLLTMFTVPFVLYPGYSASLTSHLAVTLNKAPFRSLEELSRTTEYKLGWHRSFPLENMFNLNDNSSLNEALLRNNVLPQKDMPVTDIEGIQRLCTEKFVFLTIKETLRALKPKCRYYSLKQHFKTVFTSMEMKKSTWYRYLFDRCQRTLEFTGIAARIKIQEVMKHLNLNERQVDVGARVSPFVIENMVLPFAILLSGVFCSLFVLGVEVVSIRLLTRRAVVRNSSR